MKYIAISIALFFITLFLGCTYVEPFYVLNSSDNEIRVIVSGREFSIEPDENKKIRGLHYSGAAIINKDINLSYSSALNDMVQNWREYSDKYVCHGFFGSRIDVDFTVQNQLFLLPCKKGGAVKEILPDSNISKHEAAPNKSNQQGPLAGTR